MFHAFHSNIVRRIAAFGTVGFLILFSLPLNAIAGQEVPREFFIEQKVRNITRQEAAFLSTTQAAPGDRLEFQARITWNSSQAATAPAFIRESLSSAIAFGGNFRINGVVTGGDPSTANTNIGTFQANETKVITFEAIAGDPRLFGGGATSSVAVATVTVFSGQDAASTSTTVRINVPGVPTQVPTGAVKPWMLALLITIGSFFLISYALLIKYYVSNHILRSIYETRAERKLAYLIEQIRKNEKK